MLPCIPGDILLINSEGGHFWHIILNHEKLVCNFLRTLVQTLAVLMALVCLPFIIQVKVSKR